MSKCDCVYEDFCSLINGSDIVIPTPCLYRKDNSDFVKVVRCKDCAIGKGRTAKMGAGWIYCNNNEQYHREDHFCGYGERREEK